MKTYEEYLEELGANRLAIDYTIVPTEKAYEYIVGLLENSTYKKDLNYDPERV